MFAEYAVVKLKRDLPAYNLKAGTLGATVMVHHDSPPAYEVELVDAEGDTLEVLTLTDDDLVAVPADELQRDEAA